MLKHSKYSHDKELKNEPVTWKEMEFRYNHLLPLFKIDSVDRIRLKKSIFMTGLFYTNRGYEENDFK